MELAEKIFHSLSSRNEKGKYFCDKKKLLEIFLEYNKCSSKKISCKQLLTNFLLLCRLVSIFDE